MHNGRNPNGIVLLPSKINAPSLPTNIIKRPILNERFEKTLTCPLTTVISAAGFGKTTSVLAWTKSLSDTPVAWYLLDEEDSSLDRFWLYLIAALRIADEDICQSTEGMGFSDEKESMCHIVDSLLMQISDYKRDFVCVLEDFHTVHEEPSIQETFQYFLKHLPSHVHIVITSRQPLRLSTVKMNVDGLVNCIDESHLCFSPEETGEFFSEMGVALREGDVDLIFKTTHGWPTGDKLIALLCGQGSNEEIQSAITLSQNSIDDYLFEEVLTDLNECQQKFLLNTSIVSAFCPSLAEEVTGFNQDEVIAHIDFLIQNDLFIERIERQNGEEWYRYHLLFSEMLHRRLMRINREEVGEMRRIAQDWFEEQGIYDYVVEISADLKDYERIRRLIIDKWKTFYMNDHGYILIRWSALLPHEEILKSPLICAILTMPLAFKGEFEKADRCIQYAIDSLGDKEEGYLFAFCMAQKAYIAAFVSDMEGMALYAGKALRAFSEEEFYLRSMMYQILAASKSGNDPLQAKQAFIRAIELQSKYDNKSISASGYCNTSILCANLGHYDEALSYADLAFDLYEEHERRHEPMLTYAYLTMMILSYAQGRFEEVLGAYSDFAFAAKEGFISARSAEAKAIYAKALYQLDSPLAKKEFFKAMSINESGSLEAFPSLRMIKDYCEAFRTQALQRIETSAENTQAHLFKLALRYHLGEDIPLAEIETVVRGIEEGQRSTRVSALTLAAVIAEKDAYFVKAESCFQEALSFSVKHGLSQMLKENKEYLESVAKRLDLRVLNPGEVMVLQSILESGRPSDADVHLTDRELEVMRLIASGLSLADTANKMYISRETVKKHLSNIYGKLDVHSKTQALALLREGNLL